MLHRLRQQQTLLRPAEVNGVGYWSGDDVRVEFRPSDVGAGIVFVRRDLAAPVRIAARVEHRIEVPRRTALANRGASVEMVEHVMAALSALRIDNCEVWVDAPEMPGLDGSSWPFVQALREAGVKPQSALRPRLAISAPIRLGNEDCWIEAVPRAAEDLCVQYTLDYGPETAIGRQTFELDITPESFCRELAACRTFLLKHEADWLASQKLGRRVSFKDLLIYGPEGPIDNELRFGDECVRHKMLDVVGDLALAGCDLAMRVAAHRSGHKLNAELVRSLLAAGELRTTQRRSA